MRRRSAELLGKACMLAAKTGITLDQLMDTNPSAPRLANPGGASAALDARGTRAAVPTACCRAVAKRWPHARRVLVVACWPFPGRALTVRRPCAGHVPTMCRPCVDCVQAMGFLPPLLFAAKGTIAPDEITGPAKER